MKTKYIKVLTTDRLPEEDGFYFGYRTDWGECILRFSKSNGGWTLPKDAIHRVESWLQPITDREEEMREMLEELVTHHFDFMGCGEIKELQEKAKELLNKLKQ